MLAPAHTRRYSRRLKRRLIVEQLEPRLALCTHPWTANIDAPHDSLALVAEGEPDLGSVQIIESDAKTEVRESVFLIPGGELPRIDSYTLNLDALPSGNVEVTITADDQAQVSLDARTFASTVSLNQSDMSPKTIYIRAIDDEVVEGNHISTIRHAITASDDLDHFPTSIVIPDVIVQIVDEDEPGVTITQSDGLMLAGEARAPDTYFIELDSVPAEAVEITVTADDQGEVSLDGTLFATSLSIELTDTSPTTIWVRGSDDEAVENRHATTVRHAITDSEDSNYPLTLPINDIVVALVDDESSGITLLESGGRTEVGERRGGFGGGGQGPISDTYTLALDSFPTGDVELTALADSQSEISLDGRTYHSSLTFTQNNLDARTIHVRGKDDEVVEGDHVSTIRHEIVATDDATHYPTSLTLPETIVHILDDDEAGVSLTESSNATLVGEGGPFDTYSIAFDSVPIGNVEVTVTPDDQSEVSLDGTHFAPELTFQVTDRTPQFVSVRGANDESVEGRHTSSIHHSITSSSDPNYSTDFLIADLAVEIVDDDSPAIVFSDLDRETDLLEQPGGFGKQPRSDTYKLALNSFPSGNVELTITADGQGEVSVDGIAFASSVTILQSDISSRTIRVRAVDDQLVEGNHSTTIRHEITATDDPSHYPTSLAIDDVIVPIIDDDIAGVTITESDDATLAGEGIAADTYTIELDSIPTGAVEFTVTSDVQGEVSLDGSQFFPSVTFQATDTTSKTIWVRGTEDDEIEGRHTSVLQHAITASSDVNYPTTLVLNEIQVSVIDEDSPGITLLESENRTEVGERGGGFGGQGAAVDTYTLSLDSFPTGNVELTLTADAQSQISLNGFSFSSTLTFTQGDVTPRTIHVRAIDDAATEGTHTSTIHHEISATEDPARYPASLIIPDVTVHIADDEVSAFLIVELDNENVVEFGRTTGTIFRSGADTDQELAVTLTVEPTGQAVAPPVIVLPAGVESVDFIIEAIYDSNENGSRTVEISAAADLYLSGSITLEIADNLTPWKNLNDSMDVNRDGFVTPQDALILINALNRDEGGTLAPPAALPDIFYDPNGDNFLSPNDALVVINFLNAQSGLGGKPK